MMECIFGMQINIGVFYKLILSFWVCISRHARCTQNKKFACLCNISRKAWEMKLIFCQQMNTKALYKLIVSFWVFVARHGQSTQNQFTMSLQYLKENLKDEVGFLPADKRQKFFKLILSF